MALRVLLRKTPKDEKKALTVYSGPDSDTNPQFEGFKPQNLKRGIISDPS